MDINIHLKEALVAGRTLIGSAEAEADAQHGKLAEIQREIRECESKLARLLELEREDAVKRVLGGSEEIGEKPKRKAQIANLEEHVCALQMAMPVQRERCSAADDALARTRDKFSEVVAPLCADMRLAAFNACRPALNALMEALAKAAAIDHVQDHLVGSEFVIIDPQVDGLFRATALLDSFYAAIPPRMRRLLEPKFSFRDQIVSAAAAEAIQLLEADPTRTIHEGERP